MSALERLVENLATVRLPEVFNPWRDYDKLYDQEPTAPEIRCRQLRDYLRIRLGRAKYIFLAEGLSYQGGKFTGIAMTSERILLGHHALIKPQAVMDLQAVRCSRAYGQNKKADELGMNEPTAAIVWTAILNSGIDPRDTVLWNIFPWHPHPADQYLANRTPTPAELQLGAEYFEPFRRLFPQAHLLCVGNSSQNTLRKYTALSATALRHPARGGANMFRNGLSAFVNSVTDK